MWYYSGAVGPAQLFQELVSFGLHKRAKMILVQYRNTDIGETAKSKASKIFFCNKRITHTNIKTRNKGTGEHAFFCPRPDHRQACLVNDTDVSYDAR